MNSINVFTLSVAGMMQSEDTRTLMADLREIDGVDARPVQQERRPPQGAKGADLTYALAVSAPTTVLSTSALVIRAWLIRSSRRKVVIEADGRRLELSALTMDEEREFVAMFVQAMNAEGQQTVE